jgi:hypothetical protein
VTVAFNFISERTVGTVFWIFVSRFSVSYRIWGLIRYEHWIHREEWLPLTQLFFSQNSSLSSATTLSAAIMKKQLQVVEKYLHRYRGGIIDTATKNVNKCEGYFWNILRIDFSDREVSPFKYRSF